MQRIDYLKLEQRYVQGTMSIRALADSEGVSFSAVARYSRLNDWNKKRAEYQQEMASKALATTIERIATEAAEANYEAFVAMRATVYEYMDKLRNHEISVGVNEVATAIKTMQLITGGATERKETNVVVDPIERASPAELLDLLRDVRALRTIDGTARSVGEPSPAAIVEG